jgi:hypothetical protein
MRHVFSLLALLVLVNAYGQRQNFWVLNRMSNLYVPTDSNARVFISAVINGGDYLDNVSRIAIDTLVIRLKRHGLWDKHLAIYPFIGTTASSQKWNLKDPRDADDAFRLTFYGNPVHNAAGVKWNGVNQWGDTHLKPQNVFTDNASITFYSSSNSINTEIDWAVNDSLSTNYWILYNHYPNSTSFAARFPYLRTIADLQVESTKGLYVILYDGIRTLGYFNGNNVGSVDEPNWNLPAAGSITLGAWVTNQTLVIGSTKLFAYFSIGYGNTTDIEEGNISNIVSAFLASLNRN